MVSVSLRGHQNINNSMGKDKQNGCWESLGEDVGVGGVRIEERMEQQLLTNHFISIPIFSNWYGPTSVY